MLRKNLFAAAAGVVIGGIAFATNLKIQTAEPAVPEAPTPATPVAPPIAEASEPAAPAPPLMKFCGKTGLGKQLGDSGISIGGWIEASTTWSLLDDPTADTIVGRSFDFEHADPTLNQIGFCVKREADNEKKWDLGFCIETVFGADARFISSNGMDFQTGPYPENQFDITQAYGQVVVPAGEKNMTLKAGKFITVIGYEYINPTLNPLYSHSYLFGIAPFTHTGVMATYPVTDKGTFSLGIARGWDQSLEDNNGCATEVLWSWANAPSDRFSYAFNGSVGPQMTDDTSHYRTMLDFWCDYKCSYQLSLGLNLDYRYDSNDGQDGDAAHTYGAAGYAKYTINKYAMLVGRLEWLDDTSRVEGFDCNIYAATLGVTVTPFPDDQIGQFLKIRPEIRYDYATEDLFDGGSENSTLTAAVEAVFTF